MLHRHMERWRDYCAISRQTPASKKSFCFAKKVTISHAQKRNDLLLQTLEF